MSLIPEERLETFSSYYWLHDKTFASWLVKMLAPYGKSILDVGCGDGTMIPELSSTFDTVAAIDPDCVLGERAGRVAKQFGATFLKGQAEKIPFSTAEFDIAFAKSSLHHFESIFDGLQEMNRVSKELVAVVEVVAPTEKCLPFLREILIRKESGRRLDSIFTIESLSTIIQKCIDCHASYTYLYDQLIDVEVWLNNAGLSVEDRNEIYRTLQSLDREVKTSMQLHFLSGHLVMLRRMCLCLGVKTNLMNPYHSFCV